MRIENAFGKSSYSCSMRSKDGVAVLEIWCNYKEAKEQMFHLLSTILGFDCEIERGLNWRLIINPAPDGSSVNLKGNNSVAPRLDLAIGRSRLILTDGALYFEGNIEVEDKIVALCLDKQPLAKVSP